MRFSIRIKVIAAVSLSLILIFTFIAYMLVRQNTVRLRTSQNEQTKSFAALATKPIGNTFAVYKDSGRIRITQQVNNFLELDPDLTSISVVSVDGTELYNNTSKEQGPPLEQKLAASFDAVYVKNEKGYIIKAVQPYFEESGAHRYSVVYQLSTNRAEQNLKDVVSLILYAGAVILIVSIVGTSLLLSHLFIRPLRKVSESANIISSGDYDHQVATGRNDEIGDLASSVEKMADYLKADIVKLRELDKMKSEFMMIASHNLRTPITIIQGYIDLAKDVDSSDELKNIISTIQESVVRLHLLAENVLTISTLEAGKTITHKDTTQMTKFINAMDKEFGLLATKKGLKWEFTSEIPEDVKMELSAANMRSALGNLIDNAIKFTKAGGTITIESRVESGNVVFKVSDTGVGISKSEMPKLFTKFHRGTSTLSYDYEGIGIGLYLSKLIIEEHGGKVEAESELGKGSTFTAYLPVNNPQTNPEN
ncbi:MAG TPA: HAMP domain-containing sensor histidine kinase [Candidatus Saccharimonadales bacterium]|nr:HAMP domain-containing sensor histidine kinase [Candidatus Saccharimonadales bacterium]